jgi:hypothetical protein
MQEASLLCLFESLRNGKRRLNFANFITKERLNFPAVNRYRLDIMTLGDFMNGKLSAH